MQKLLYSLSIGIAVSIFGYAYQIPLPIQLAFSVLASYYLTKGEVNNDL